MTLEKKDHWNRNFILGTCLIMGSAIGCLHFLVIQPTVDHYTQLAKEDDQKTQAEHDKILSMNCKQLGDWLLQDSWFNRDNLGLAQSHYLVECRK